MSETLENGSTTITAAELFGSNSETPAPEKTQSENAGGNSADAASGAAKENETAAKEGKVGKKNSEGGDDPKADGDDPDADGDEPKEEKASGFEKRLKKLLKKNQKASQERDYWREQALNAKSQSDSKSQKTESQAAQDDEPNAADFDSYEAYQKAIIQHNIKNALNPALDEIKKTISGSKASAEADDSVKAFGSRVKEFSKENSDYQEVVKSLNGINVDKSVEQALIQSELGPAVLYELGKNPDLAEELAELPPHLQMKEIGKIEARIEARLEAKKNPPAPKTTKAPTPPNPVGSKGEGKKSVNDPGLSAIDFMKMRNEEEKQKRNQFF